MFHSEDYDIDKNIELLIDSIHFTKNQEYENLKNVLLSKIDSLALDQDTLFFFRSKLDIFGEEVFLYGIQFVYLLCYQLLNNNGLIKSVYNGGLNKEKEITNPSRLATCNHQQLRVNNLIVYNNELRNKLLFFKKLVETILVDKYYKYCDKNDKFADEKADFENVNKQTFQDILKKFDSLFKDFYDQLITRPNIENVDNDKGKI